MRDAVIVSVAARLHLGFLDLNGGLGRRFGSLGLAIDEPATVLELCRGRDDSAEGPQADRVMRHIERLADHLRLPHGHQLLVRQAIPRHAGLGSGTQLAMAAAAALRRLHRLPLDPRSDAVLLDRSARSGLGTGFFQQGGLALDGGRGTAETPPPILARLPFPGEWRVLLILDPARQGMHGSAELAAFGALPQFPAEIAAHLCRLTLMQALPAVAEHDIGAFGRAVTEIQVRIGDYFAPAQGGRYASPGVAAALDLLAGLGVAGYGQSSWGPTGFAFAASLAEARIWRDRLSALAASEGLQLMIVKGRDHGAVVSEQTRASEKGVRHG
jgi:beta-ribofuranosylaminobenzene 5'-phosphate synthase